MAWQVLFKQETSYVMFAGVVWCKVVCACRRRGGSVALLLERSGSSLSEICMPSLSVPVCLPCLEMFACSCRLPGVQQASRTGIWEVKVKMGKGDVLSSMPGSVLPEGGVQREIKCAKACASSGILPRGVGRRRCVRGRKRGKSEGREEGRVEREVRGRWQAEVEKVKRGVQAGGEERSEMMTEMIER